MSIDNFKAKLINGGARPNLFKVTLNFPGYAGGDSELTSFMCKAASLPASTVEAIDVPFKGRVLKVAGDRTFEPWQVTIINEGTFSIRNAFERWMNGLNEHQNNLGILNPTEYSADLSVDQLDRQDNVIKTYNIVSAFPTALSAIEVSYETNNALEEFTVDFAYNYWTSDTTS